MFPRLPARATSVADTKNVSYFFRNILCPQQMFPSLRSPRNIMGYNMCPQQSVLVCQGLYGFLLRFSTIGGLILVQYSQADTTWEWLLLTRTTHTTRSWNMVYGSYRSLHNIMVTCISLVRQLFYLNSMTHMSCIGHTGCEQLFMSPTVGELHI